jgi:hypothetical protein
VALDRWRQPRRARAGGPLAAAVALMAICASAACTASPSAKPPPASERGTIVGAAPICYGPGPNMNLKPRTTIRAIPINGGTPTAIRITTNGAHHSYRMALSPGRYKISTYSGSVEVTVRAGITQRGVDLPPPGCI